MASINASSLAHEHDSRTKDTWTFTAQKGFFAHDDDPPKWEFRSVSPVETHRAHYILNYIVDDATSLWLA